VFNNLGVCYLQLARRELGEKGWLYWLPIQLEIDNRMEPLLTGTMRGYDSVADNYLSQARQAFEHASQMDAHYTPAWLNLAITLFYQQDIFVARAAIEKARALSPNDTHVAGMRALIIADEGFGADTWSQAIVLLEELLNDPEVSPLWLYNTAQLLRQRSRTVPNAYWQRLATYTLPSPIQQVVCAQVACATSAENKPAKSLEELIKLPVKLGSYLRRDPPAQAYLTPFTRFDFDWQKAVYGTLYQTPTEEILVLAGYVEMVVLHDLAISVEQLQAACPFSLQKTDVVQGQLWHCDTWSALLQAEKIQQIWMVNDETQKK
jgi:tetratricopeptide (TPR) repeat protein